MPARSAHLLRNECPELSGTFDIAFTRAGSAVDPFPSPKTHGLPIVVTFRQGPAQAEAWWVVPREHLLSFATTLSTQIPARYARWRDLLLTAHPPLRPQIDDYLAQIAELGPPGPVDTGFSPKRCRDNWMLASTAIEFAHRAKDGTYSLSHETWFAHDRSGALLVKHLAYKAGTIPLPDALRRTRIAEYTRYEPLAFEAPTPLAATELPALPLCEERSARIARFSQQLKTLLPPQSALTQFTPRPATLEEARSYCPGIVVDFEIAGNESADLARIDALLKAEDGLERIEAISMRPGEQGGQVRALRVVMH